MQVILQEVPIEAALFGPFVALTEILPHEEKFFAGMGVLIREEEAEIGELLPHVAGHFVEERVFAVHDFVMREGKHEIFGESINERKGDFVVLVLAVDRI